MSALSFKNIQDAVLQDAFAESRRADVKNWIVARHAWLWDAAEWSFKFATGTITFTANSQTVGLGSITDFQNAVAVYDSQGYPVAPIKDFRDFFDAYNTLAVTDTGSPDVYTVMGSSILVGPKGDGTSGMLVYEKAKPTLSADSDITGLPDGYDLALVHGAKATGFKLANVPLWQDKDAEFTAAVNALKLNYMVKVRAQGQQWGAYRPGIPY